LMVDPQKMQHRRVKIVHRHRATKKVPDTF
jgi:hypothetical protein